MAVMLMLALESLADASHPISLALRFWVFGFVYLSCGRADRIMLVRRSAPDERSNRKLHCRRRL